MIDTLSSSPMMSSGVRLRRPAKRMGELNLSTALTMLLAFKTAVCEDLASSAPYNYHMVASERETITSANINITWEEDSVWKTNKSVTGRYGSGFVGSASGLLVHITSAAAASPDDHTGCHLPFRSTRPDGALPKEPWIALIKRGGCNFEDKVKNAYQSHAVGVIVYNDRDAKELDKMKLTPGNGLLEEPKEEDERKNLDLLLFRTSILNEGARMLSTPSRLTSRSDKAFRESSSSFGLQDTTNKELRGNISAVFTYKSKGEEMAKLVENYSKVLVHITIGSHTLTRTNINKTSVLFVSITFIVLMIISLAWLVFYYVQRFRYIHAKDRLSKRLCNAAKKALSKIPTKNIKNGDKELQGDGECCAICIEPYRVSEILRTLPCSHEFHKSCIDPWLLEHRTCPMCKMDILKHYGFVFTGSQESILHMEVEEVVALDGGGVNNDNSPARRNGGGISPLPQIRAIIVNDNQRYIHSDSDHHSSRSSSPNEMTPSLSNRQMLPVRQDLCVSCIAAAAAMAIEKREPQQHQTAAAATTTATNTAAATAAFSNNSNIMTPTMTASATYPATGGAPNMIDSDEARLSAASASSRKMQ